MTAYYNENDPYAAQWLRNLINDGHIAPGDVDCRSIADVRASDLRSYNQCHFFAGIGVWSHALRRAGWADDRPVWTGSCPCQPFSGAGKREGIEDARHLWPVWFRLIRECRPGVVIGEQVASKDALAWWDAVSDDLESEAYAAGAVDLCAAGIGAPHIRQRLFWVAHTDSGTGGQGRPIVARGDRGSDALARPGPGCNGGARKLANASGAGSSPRERRRSGKTGNGCDPARQQPERLCDAGGLADADGGHAGTERQQRSREHRQQPEDGGAGDGRTGPLNGFWRDADWLLCTDGKWRPVEPGSFPLAHGVANRVGKLRAYGNAINAEQAIQFIEAVT